MYGKLFSKLQMKSLIVSANRVAVTISTYIVYQRKKLRWTTKLTNKHWMPTTHWKVFEIFNLVIRIKTNFLLNLPQKSLESYVKVCQRCFKYQTIFHNRIWNIFFASIYNLAVLSVERSANATAGVLVTKFPWRLAAKSSEIDGKIWPFNQSFECRKWSIKCCSIDSTAFKRDLQEC